MIMKKNILTFTKACGLILILWAVSSCEEMLEIPYPKNALSTATAFENKTIIDGMMNQMYISFSDGLLGGSQVARQMAALSDDEYNPTATSSTLDAQNANITAATYMYPNWNTCYRAIYLANTLLEGLPGANAVGFDEATKNAYMGAALTVRAQAHYDLVRCYGDVPLVLTSVTDEVKSIARTPKSQVYAQIEADLKQAITLLPSTKGNRYMISNEYVPESILASVYLTQGKWADAETAATDVISTGGYQLATVTDVFLQSSKETIMARGYTNYWGVSTPNTAPCSGLLLPAGTSGSVYESILMTLSEDLLNSFETGDWRKANWVILKNAAGYPNPNNRMFCYKWKYNQMLQSTIVVPAGKEEDQPFIRLAEIYLIRAEARAHQNNLTGAAEDLNLIRTRAGLANTTAASQTDMIEAVLRERRVELFFEYGFRWFDLVRTGKADAILSNIPYKTANWKSHMVLFPIPKVELDYNHNLVQNLGY